MSWSSGPSLKLMLGRTVGFAATFFIPLLLVRIFSPAEFGTYKQLFLLYAAIYPLAQVGMAESLFYFLPSERAHGGRFLLNAILVLAASGAVCLGLLWLGRGHIAAWMNNEALATLAPLIGVYLLFMLVSSVLEIVLISREQYGRASLVYTASDLVRAALLVLPALVFASIEWVILGAIAFAALRLLGTIAHLRREFRDELRPSRRLVKAQIAYTAPFQLAVVFEILQFNVPHFAVSRAFGAAAYAVYAVGCLQLPVTDFIASSVCNVMMVKVREAASAHNHRAVVRLWRAATRDLAFVFIPLTVFLWIVAADLIVLLFTDTYRAAVPIFMIWTSTILLSIVQTDGILRAHAEMRFLVLMNAARLAIVLGSVGVLMRGWGLQGAALSAVAALAAGKALAMWRLRRVVGVPMRVILPWPALGKAALAAVLAATPTVAWVRWASPIDVISLAGGTAIFWGAYLVAATALDTLPTGVRPALALRWRRLRPAWPLASQQGE